MDSTLNSNDPVERLFARINYEKQTRFSSVDFKLNNMFQFLSRLGDPHLKCPVVHVAGTKGKGSVCQFVGSILSAAGYNVGIYTSPHLERINQRIQFGGHEISDQDLRCILGKLEPVLQAMDVEAKAGGTKPLTFFEVITTVAFQYFADRHADVVVLEVGMGGRLDSTNVCQPEVCVITNISLDHTRQLGTTTDKIAAEKAGILKPGVDAICGETQDIPKNVIHKIADTVGCSLFQLGRDFDLESSETSFDYVSRIGTADRLRDGLDAPPNNQQTRRLDNLRPSMLGEHQQINAALATAVSDLLNQKGWGHFR